MVVFDRKYTTVFLHHGVFPQCPDNSHMHKGHINIAAKSSLKDFYIDPIVTIEVDDMEGFVDLIRNECETNKIEVISVAVYLEDIDETITKFYE